MVFLVLLFSQAGSAIDPAFFLPMSDYERNSIYERTFEVLMTVLSGKPCTIQTFAYLELHPKSVRRMLDSLMKIKKAKITRVKREGVTVWFSSYPMHKPGYLNGEKRCQRCLALKDKLDFHKNAYNGDGLQQFCADCSIEKSNEYRRTHKDKVNAAQRRRYKANPTKHTQRYRDYYEENAEELRRKRRERYARQKKDHKKQTV